MESSMKFMLAGALLVVAWFHSGNALKCYTCVTASGNLTAAKLEADRDATDTACLNKDSVECAAGSCGRSTKIVYKPSEVAYEVNTQSCGGRGGGGRDRHGCYRTDDWSHDGTVSSRTIACSCNTTDNCNSATNTNGNLLLSLALSATYGGIWLYTGQ